MSRISVSAISPAAWPTSATSTAGCARLARPARKSAVPQRKDASSEAGAPVTRRPYGRASASPSGEYLPRREPLGERRLSRRRGVGGGLVGRLLAADEIGVRAGLVRELECEQL